jgi:hypothetical protein
MNISPGAAVTGQFLLTDNPVVWGRVVGVGVGCASAGNETSSPRGRSAQRFRRIETLFGESIAFHLPGNRP